MKSVLLETQGRADEGRGDGHPRHLRGRRSIRRSSCSTACWSPSGGGRTRRFPGSSARTCRSIERGFIMVDEQRRTHEPSIFAIGDVVGEPMLAHKASHEGRVAVEVIAGENVAFAPRAIPAVVFTDPEIAWCRPDRGAGGEGGAARHGREVPVGRVRPRDHARSHRRPDEADSRSGDRAAARRRPRRSRRRRADRRRRPRDRDGRERHRPEADDPPAPDADRDDDGVGRSVLRPGDARLPAEARLES